MDRSSDELAAIAAFADALPVAVWVGRAPGGEVVYVNREFERILGITPPDGAARGNYVGPYGVHTLTGEQYPEDRMPFERVLRSKRTEVIDDLVVHRHDDTKAYLRVFAKPIFAADGTVAYVVEAFTDRTREVEAERQRAEGEQQLQAVRRLESLGSLAGGVAHDFNNLLGIVKLVAAQLRRGETDADRLELVRYLDDVADSAAKLTRALLGFARRGKHLARPLSVHEVVESVLELAQRTFERRITVTSDLAASPDVVVGDAAQIEQVIMNLVMNARDALPGPGTIVVRSRREELAAGEHPLLPAGPYIVLEVEDTGTGIDPAVLDRVFEPYVSTKGAGSLKGTGLGLATVYGVAQAHGGSAEIAATSPRGTRMKVLLPASDAQVADAAERVDPRPAAGAGTILVVDDEPLVLRMTARVLAQSGYEVLTASSGEAAIETFRAAGDRVRAVVLDMVMPGMGGKETFVELRRLDPAVRVLLTTGYALNHDAQQILDLGVRGLVSKPFDGDELGRALARVLQS